MQLEVSEQHYLVSAFVTAKVNTIVVTRSPVISTCMENLVGSVK